VRRPWQRLAPGWDAHVVFRQVCTACGMRYEVEPNTTEVQPAGGAIPAVQADDAARS
jgi:hypothetical protein